MRMWLGVHPSEMCDKHLRGEHGELHKLHGSMLRACDPSHPRQQQHERSVSALVALGFLDIERIYPRHGALHQEAWRRGFEWHSPIPFGITMQWAPRVPSIEHDNERDRADLAGRCPECAERMVDDE